MKTSILVSSFAALCLLITFAEAPTRNTADRINLSSVSNIYSLPENIVIVKPASKLSANLKKNAVYNNDVELAEDLSYLKFNASDYVGDEPATEVSTENTLEYLKFNVAEFTESNELTSFDVIDLPVNDLEYLKFEVNDYVNSGDAVSSESIELPVNEFDNIKFDVTNFINTDERNSVEIEVLPVDEFSYLKFDVNKYAASNSCTDNFGELPVN